MLSALVLVWALLSAVVAWRDASRRGPNPVTALEAEFQSLSLEPLVIEKNGKEVWAPKGPGVVFKAFEGSGEPSASKSQRLVAMKRLAAEFTVELSDW